MMIVFAGHAAAAERKPALPRTAPAPQANPQAQSETTPAAKEVNPRALFDRLFRGGEEDAEGEALRRESIRRALKEQLAARGIRPWLVEPL